MDNSQAFSYNGYSQSQLKCKICFVPYANKQGLTNHLKRVHNVVHVVQETGSIPVSPLTIISKDLSKSTQKCHICSASFTSHLSLSRHLKYDHPVELQCTDCKKVFKRPNYLEHRKYGCPKKLNLDSSPLIITSVISLSSATPRSTTPEPTQPVEVPTQQIQSPTQSLIGCVICAFSNVPEDVVPNFSSFDQLEKHKAMCHPEHIILTELPPLTELGLDQSQFKICCRSFLKSEIEFSRASGSVCPYCQIKRSFLDCKKAEFMEHLITSHLTILVDKIRRQLEKSRRESEKSRDAGDDDEIQVVAEVIDLVDDDD